MKKLLTSLFLLFFFACSSNNETVKENDMKKNEKLNYPVAKKIETEDDYFGFKVKDNYRYMEDAENKDSIEWVEKQNKLTEDFLNTPEKEKIKERFAQLYSFDKHSIPSKKGNFLFYYKKTGLQDQYILYRKDLTTNTEVVLIDPNTLSKDGTIALTETYTTKDAFLMAYGLNQSGSDSQTYYIKDLKTMKDLDDKLEHLRWPSIAWLADNSGFYYSKYPTPGSVQKEEETFYNKVYFHKIGTKQEEDKVIYEDKEHKTWIFAPYITNDNKYLTITVYEGTDPKTQFYYKELGKEGDFVKLLTKMDSKYEFMGNKGNLFYFNTDLNAPKGKIVSIDITEKETKLVNVTEEQKEAISYTIIANNELFVVYLKDAQSVLKRFKLDGTFLGEIELPSIGSIEGLSGNIDGDSFYIEFTSFLYPNSIFQFDFKANKLVDFFIPKTAFDITKYETKQVFYESKDKTKIPLFLVYKKGLQLTGDNPTLLYGYGGFNVNMTPYFSVSRTIWLEHGGVYAVPILRGGGEYGKDWHQGGMLDKKQNVFDDFIYAAKWLIENKYTNSKKLAIMGGSNGGLLVAAVMVQEPSLFGAVVCEVPLTDMLRFHKFTVGHYWIPEYGNAENSKEEFEYLYKYSPYHNVKKGVSYPSTIVMSADSDDRVVPLHAKKFAAILQENNEGENPLLLYIEPKAGHGHSKPTSKVIEEISKIYGFLFKIFEMK